MLPDEIALYPYTLQSNIIQYANYPSLNNTLYIKSAVKAHKGTDVGWEKEHVLCYLTGQNLIPGLFHALQRARMRHLCYLGHGGAQIILVNILIARKTSCITASAC